MERASAAASEPASYRPVAELAAACCTPQPAADTAALGGLPLPPAGAAALVAAGVLAAGYGIKRVLDTPSRTYRENVGDEYDAWTDEGVLEYYWGEHIHLGYYTPEVRAPPARGGGRAGGCLLAAAWGWYIHMPPPPPPPTHTACPPCCCSHSAAGQERAAGYTRKSFKQAKFDFVDEMLAWSGAKSPPTILDVGCGIGGTSRYLANKFPQSKVTGEAPGANGRVGSRHGLASAVCGASERRLRVAPPPRQASRCRPSKLHAALRWRPSAAWATQSSR